MAAWSRAATHVALKARGLTAACLWDAAVSVQSNGGVVEAPPRGKHMTLDYNSVSDEYPDIYEHTMSSRPYRGTQ